MRKRKKGNAATETFTLILLLFGLAIGIFVVGMILDNFRDEFQADPDIPQIAKDVNENGTENTISMMDHLFFMTFILFWGISILLALDIGTTSAWMWIGLGLSAFVILFAVMMTSAYEDFAEDADVAPYTSVFPKVHFIMSNLGKTMVVFFTTVFIALYAKSTAGGG